MAKLIITNDSAKSNILIELEDGSQIELNADRKELIEALNSDEQTVISVSQVQPGSTEDILDDADDDLREVLEKHIEGLVESHLEGWKERYYMKSVDDISTDLYVNHDSSLEIEFVEEKLGRELKDNEHSLVESYFNESVLDKFR